MVAGHFLFHGEKEPRRCIIRAIGIENVKGGMEELRKWEEILEHANKDSRNAFVLLCSSALAGLAIGMMINWVLRGNPI